ncbi:MAG: hypothetical protein E6G26_01270 [Actinobacteria bacterium]|nr:MAG: hypothetical protein E6G26_01270 [Actinomycetota bacterium]
MRRRPIGQILVEKGEISEIDLEAALAEQERSGRRLGEILIEQGRTSWLALARAIAEQVLDIQGSSAVAKPEPEPEAALDPVKMVRELAERVANLPPVPDLLPPPPVPDLERQLAREVAEQVANLDTPTSAPQPETRLLHLTPAPKPEPPALMSSDEKLLSIEALLKERQRAFIEMVTTTETLRMKIARLEEILEERDRELAKLRIARAV